MHTMQKRDDMWVVQFAVEPGATRFEIAECESPFAAAQVVSFLNGGIWPQRMNEVHWLEGK